MPDAMAYWLTTTILTANFFAVYDFLRYYGYAKLPFNVVFAFIVFGIIAMLNYIIIFVNGSYKEEKPSAKFGIGVVIYMLISIGVVIYIGSLHRERNLIEKQQQIRIK